MSTDLATRPQEHVHVPLRHARLPAFAPLLAAGIAVAASAILGLALGWPVPGIVVVAILLHLVGLTLWSRAVENARAATDRLMTSLVWIALLIALIPLVSLLWKVVAEGSPAINSRFLTWSMRNVIGEPGGIYHAIVGTLLITLAATVISVLIGLLSAIYLVEYGDRSQL